MARYAIVQVMVEVADDESVDDVRGVDTKHTYYDKVIQYTVNYFKTEDIVVVEW
jgi:hypothetical protein